MGAFCSVPGSRPPRIGSNSVGQTVRFERVDCNPSRREGEGGKGASEVHCYMAGSGSCSFQ